MRELQTKKQNRLNNLMGWILLGLVGVATPDNHIPDVISDKKGQKIRKNSFEVYIKKPYTFLFLFVKHTNEAIFLYSLT